MGSLRLKAITYVSGGYPTTMDTNYGFECKDQLYTKLENGELIVFIRHYKFEHRGGVDYNGAYYFSKDEDTIISRNKVDDPKCKWNNTPFMDYNKYLPGRLTYSQFCDAVSKTNMWVFNDFTGLSDRAFDGLVKCSTYSFK